MIANTSNTQKRVYTMVGSTVVIFVLFSVRSLSLGFIISSILAMVGCYLLSVVSWSWLIISFMVNLLKKISSSPSPMVYIVCYNSLPEKASYEHAENDSCVHDVEFYCLIFVYFGNINCSATYFMPIHKTSQVKIL